MFEQRGLLLAMDRCWKDRGPGGAPCWERLSGGFWDVPGGGGSQERMGVREGGEPGMVWSREGEMGSVLDSINIAPAEMGWRWHWWPGRKKGTPEGTQSDKF